MGLLNHLFGSTESLAKEIVRADEDILNHWNHYLGATHKKKELILRLDPTNLKSSLHELAVLLKLELVDISTEKRKESELLADLDRLEHSKKIRRVHRLDQCLGYAETKYEYVQGLLAHLFSVLKYQMHLAANLQKKPKDPQRLISHLQSQSEVEHTIISKIENIGTFHELFLALVKGEHIIRTMDAKEKRLLKMMRSRMGKIFSNEIKEGMTSDWTMSVYEQIENKVHEGVANGMFPGYHPDIDFQFANRPEFVDLVRESIQNLKKTKTSEQMINVFVHMFREWYNHERD